MKGIDWAAVGRELLPRAGGIETDEDFGLLCMELVARLQDSHAQMLPGTAKLPVPQMPRWDPGFACLIDDRQKPVVYYVDRDGPAERAGVRVGMTVLSVNGAPAAAAIEQCMERTSRYYGYSSRRYLEYQAARMFMRQMEPGSTVALTLEDAGGRKHSLELPATLGVRYLPRLPVPNRGIADSGEVSWKMLDDGVGYIYVRRIKGKLIDSLDRAVAELAQARGLIVDVRGNSGGGFDSRRAHRNFALDDGEEPDRPRFRGPMAILIDARCISAGEGWASWFIANGRARTFGEATAGASSRKQTLPVMGGLYRVRVPVKAYCGFLDRPIERRGLEPDVAVRQNARDLAAGRDTVLEAARAFLRDADATKAD
jgi:C-terminal processing protease CtpA/Prc